MRGMRKMERDALTPAKMRDVVMPRVWARRIGSGVSDAILVSSCLIWGWNL